MIMGKASSSFAGCKTKCSICDCLSCDRTIFTHSPAKEWIDDRTCDLCQTFTEPQIIDAPAFKQARLQYIQPPELQLRKLAFHFAFDTQVKILRAGIGANRADCDHPFNTGLARGLCCIDDEMLVYITERVFIAPCTFPGRS